MSLLAELEDHTKHLRTDLSIIEDIFRDATFQRGPAIALGNGAQLTENEFSRYEDVSDHVFSTLRKVHKLSLKIERKATSLDGHEMAQTTNALGETYTKLDQLLQSRELILQRGWKELGSMPEALNRSSTNSEVSSVPDREPRTHDAARITQLVLRGYV